MLYLIRCEWELQFKNTIIRVKSKEMIDLLFSCGGKICNLINYLATKSKCLNRSGLGFSHISEMKITVTTSLRNMTYNHYLEQPKSMLECVLKKKTYENPNLLKIVGMPLTVVWKYEGVNLDDI